MNHNEEILSGLDKLELEEISDLFNSIDYSKLKNSKSDIQSALITLSKGEISSLKNYKKLLHRKEDEIIKATNILKTDQIHVNDIRIAENKYIKWIPLKPNDVSQNIDNFLNPTLHFWDSLATECAFECCGIAACNFEKENIIKAQSELNDNNIREKFKILIKELETISNEVVGSTYLNQNFNKKVFLDLLRQIEGHLSTNSTD